jgi:hypothetical protein
MQIILIIKLKRKDMKKLLFIFMIFFITSFANAEQKYFWTDENGQTHVSETEPENWGTQSYEETKESKQTEILRVREEAIKEPQIKAAEERKSKSTTKRKKG